MFPVENFKMIRLGILLTVAICWIAAGANSASAAYGGAISYRNCGGCGNQAVDGGTIEGTPVAGGTYTVMRTVREVVYDQVQQTCHRERNEIHYEDRQIQAVRMVPETTTRQVQ
jgi:hypothetical protein